MAPPNSTGSTPVGLAPLTRQIEGVEVGITIREKPDGTCKASLRTFESVNAAEIAKAFGGGGHPLRRGRGVAKTAGIRRNAGIQAVGHAFIQGHAHLPDHLVDDLAGSSGTVVQQQPIRIIRIGAVVVNTQINMVLTLNGTQQPLGSHIHRHHIPGGELHRHNIVKKIIVLGGNVCLVLHIGELALLQQRPAKSKAAAQGVPVRVGMGQN